MIEDTNDILFDFEDDGEDDTQCRCYTQWFIIFVLSILIVFLVILGPKGVAKQMGKKTKKIERSFKNGYIFGDSIPENKKDTIWIQNK